MQGGARAGDSRSKIEENVEFRGGPYYDRAAFLENPFIRFRCPRMANARHDDLADLSGRARDLICDPRWGGCRRERLRHLNVTEVAFASGFARLAFTRARFLGPRRGCNAHIGR